MDNCLLTASDLEDMSAVFRCEFKKGQDPETPYVMSDSGVRIETAIIKDFYFWHQ